MGTGIFQAGKPRTFSVSLSAKASTAVGVFFMPSGPVEQESLGKPIKNGNPGTLLNGRGGQDVMGPLGHAPEVTAADQEGGASRLLRYIMPCWGV